MTAAPARTLAVVLHDVAPARWDACRRVLDALDGAAVGPLPLTLLVVPRWHCRGDAPPGYLAWLHHLARCGHELALHGFTHLDQGPPPLHWRERLLRRHYTAGEAEFAALPFDLARARLGAARQWAAARGLAMPGFVPPAWLAGAESRRAIAAAGFEWTCTLTTLQRLPAGLPRRAPALVYSTRSAWRRQASLAWNRALALAARRAPLLRLELHPDDADHAAVRRSWQHLLAEALADGRAPLTLGRAAGTPPAAAPP